MEGYHEDKRCLTTGVIHNTELKNANDGTTYCRIKLYNDDTI